MRKFKRDLFCHIYLYQNPYKKYDTLTTNGEDFFLIINIEQNANMPIFEKDITFDCTCYSGTSKSRLWIKIMYFFYKLFKK